MSEYQITAEHSESSTELRQLHESLDQSNMDIIGDREYWPVIFCVRNARGELCGGIGCDIWGGWLHIQVLWLRAEARGYGLGAELLRRAERYAVERGCSRAYVSSFSFQAPGLYTKFGYQVFGELTNFPPGHTHYFLQKHLTMDDG
jgi:ribosomal protein S18 acetylase RimI-like enzyme